MPLDLQPCVNQVSNPTNVDIYSRSFMPDKNIPSVRETIRTKRERQTRPDPNKFVDSMEERLLRWKAPASSHRGSNMIINGTHPYQAPTSKISSSVRASHDGLIGCTTHKIRRSFSLSSYNNDYNDSILDSFSQWWKSGTKSMANTEKQLSKRRTKNPLDVVLDENNDDSFTFNALSTVRIVRDEEGEENVGISTPYAVPYFPEPKGTEACHMFSPGSFHMLQQNNCQQQDSNLREWFGACFSNDFNCRT